jgi:hypothetical protein
MSKNIITAFDKCEEETGAEERRDGGRKERSNIERMTNAGK